MDKEFESIFNHWSERLTEKERENEALVNEFIESTLRPFLITLLNRGTGPAIASLIKK